MNTGSLCGAREAGAIPKYAALEIERRWLVDLAAVGDLSNVPYRDIEDRYLADSRLRLRRIAHPDGAVVYKLGKKYGRRPAGAEPVTTIYLTRLEHEWLSVLPGAVTLKRRYRVAGGALDVHRRPREGLAIFEVEFEHEDAARDYRPPSFTLGESRASLRSRARPWPRRREHRRGRRHRPHAGRPRALAVVPTDPGGRSPDVHCGVMRAGLDCASSPQ
jgi:hypothetical protein